MEQTANSHGAEEVGSIMNPNEVTEEPNVTPDILLPKRRRVPDTCEIKVSNRPEQVDVQEANDHLDTHFQMAAPVEIPESSNEFKTNRMEFAHTLVNQGVFYNNDSSPYPIPMQPTTTLQGWGLIKAPSSYQDQFTSDAYNGYQISDCATSSVSVESPASSSAQLLDDGAYTTPTTEHGLNSIQPVQKECYHNMFSSTACDSDFLCSNGALNSSSMEPLVYGGYTTTPVLSGNSNEDGPTLLNVQIVGDQSTQDDADDDSHFPRSNGYEATISDHVEVEWSLRNLKIV
uniref:Uncharacterized protein n=2 Tax=Lactuca sativa TaxID=4236 RepID=A0A9R1UEG0_LACSA|nr:hypothetical protein LSAT_V11C900475930 [Lactuca sativa]